MKPRLFFCSSVLLLLTACQTSLYSPSAPASAASAPAETASSSTIPAHNTVLLVSLDGFHPSHLAHAPHLQALAASGVQAQWMTPSYPSLTFPNHYTLATGLHPDHHGIIHNTMEDAELGKFSLSLRSAVNDGNWWQQGTPIWVSAEKAGLITATMFWPGSEARIDGVRPRHWLAYDGQITMEARVNTVLGWLQQPPSQRPHFVTLYFEHVDSQGHRHGPDAQQTLHSVQQVDAALGQLIAGLRQHGLETSVNLIVVSDHGMAAVPAGQMVAIESMVDAANARAISTGQSVGFEPVAGRQAQAEAQLLGRHAHYQCWRKHELPSQWQYGSNARIPAIICQMDEGFEARSAASVARYARQNNTRGAHGYDPQLPSMRAIFIASGPAFAQGVQIAAIRSVDVYPLMMRLIGVPANRHDGDIRATEAALRSP